MRTACVMTCRLLIDFTCATPLSRVITRSPGTRSHTARSPLSVMMVLSAQRPERIEGEPPVKLPLFRPTVFGFMAFLACLLPQFFNRLWQESVNVVLFLGRPARFTTFFALASVAELC